MKESKRYAKYIIKNKSTIRDAADNFGISKSSLHAKVTKLKDTHPRLYKKLKAILDFNFAVKHLRGGQTTKLRSIVRDCPPLKH